MEVLGPGEGGSGPRPRLLYPSDPLLGPCPALYPILNIIQTEVNRGIIGICVHTHNRVEARFLFIVLNSDHDYSSVISLPSPVPFLDYLPVGFTLQYYLHLFMYICTAPPSLLLSPSLPFPPFPSPPLLSLSSLSLTYAYRPPLQYHSPPH